MKHGKYEYPISYQLIKDGRKNKILHKKITHNIKIVMIHEAKIVCPCYLFQKDLKNFQNFKKKNNCNKKW